MDDGAGDADELLLAAGELRRVEVFFADDVELVQCVRHESLALGAGDVLVGERQVDVLGDGQVVEQVVALEDHADTASGEVGALFAVEGMDGRVVEEELAAPCVVEHGEDVEQ